ncbi:MAG: hypothetical protein EXR43_01730 [Dehalococcoidia bacterium]|nr:hypothetical protein [Dehalococcoidia bacterium]
MPSTANPGGSNRPRRAPQNRRTPALRPAQAQLEAAAPAPAAPDAGAGKLRVVRAAGAAVPASARLTRDYGHVRGELVRIAVLAIIIFSAIGALAVTWP